MVGLGISLGLGIGTSGSGGPRTNLTIRSQEYNNPAWGTSNLSVAADQITAPDGTLTADRLTATATGSACYIFQAYTLLANTQYTLSQYAHPGTKGWFNQTVYDGSAGNRYWYNTSTGVVGSTALVGAGLTSVSALILPADNGFYRCITTFTTKAATTITTYSTFTDADASLAITSGGTGYAWGCQLELGPTATAYIPTAGAPVTV